MIYKKINLYLIQILKYQKYGNVEDTFFNRRKSNNRPTTFLIHLYFRRLFRLIYFHMWEGGAFTKCGDRYLWKNSFVSPAIKTRSRDDLDHVSHIGIEWYVAPRAHYALMVLNFLKSTRGLYSHFFGFVAIWDQHYIGSSSFYVMYLFVV